ncbi:MAG: bacillithiol biosynthesis cysteine-adding enzyme BshC [Candidatus Acidiferrales bacterium]
MESHCLSFRDVPHTTKLFASYLENFERTSRYFAHPPTVAGIAAAAREVQLDPAVRRGVVEVLREQNRRFGSDASTDRNLDRLADGAVAIVTGQQVGLFSGPAYSFYKAVSAVRWAEEFTSRGTDAVPIFWLATEDHDLAEINHTFWNTSRGLVRYDLPNSERDSGHRVGEVVLGPAVSALAARTTESLEGTSADEIARALRESYTPQETYGSAFGKLMARLLAGRGIIFIDPLDARLHRFAAGVYLRALDDAESLRDSLIARSKEVEHSGFHAQVRVTRESTLLFFNANGERLPLRSRNGKFIAGKSSFTVEELRAAIEKTPESFTANVLLRPVVQDTILPTIAYIGGPAEIAYMAQAQIVYKKLLGRMPAILPRESFTLVDPPIARLLKKYDLEVRDVFRGRQHLRAKMEQKSLPRALSRRFEADEKTLRKLLKAYRNPLKRLDRTLLGALDSAERKILHQFLNLKEKSGRAENLRTGILDRHERILLDSLYPHKDLQERTLCLLPALAAFGSELLDRLREACRPGDDSSRGHQHRILFL